MLQCKPGSACVGKTAKRPSSLKTAGNTLIKERRSTPEGGLGGQLAGSNRTYPEKGIENSNNRELFVTDVTSTSHLCSVTSHVAAKASYDGCYMQQENATLIEVIKELTPSFSCKEPSSYPLLSRPITAEVRSQSSDSAAPSIGRQRTLSERSSLTTSSTSQYHSDSGYDTGDRNSTYQSLETSHEENPHKKVIPPTALGKIANRDELVSNLLQGITTLTQKAQEDTSDYSAHEELDVNLPPLSWDKPGTKTNAVLDIELRHSLEYAKDYKSFASPQGSPVTPRRFKSPACIRTEGVDFEEKWTFFEIITSPPDEFRDMLPNKPTPKTSPRQSPAKVNTPLVSPKRQTSPIKTASHSPSSRASKLAGVVERKEKVLANSLSHHGHSPDINNNWSTNSQAKDGHQPVVVKASVVPNRRPYRAVRKNRPKQNAQTSTDSGVISLDAGSHNVTKPKLRSPGYSSSNNDYGSIQKQSSADVVTSHQDIVDSTVGKTHKSSGNPSSSDTLCESDQNTIQETCGKSHGNNITSSPILKRLFSTTMSRGLQVKTCIIM